MRRYDVTNSSYVESKTGYNLTGSVIFRRDPLGSATRQATIEYADAYYDNTTTLANLNTFAYPTKVTDPDGYFSTTAYEYYWGAVKKQTNPKGATVRSDYDPTTGLLMKVTNEVNSAQTEYVYDASKTWVETYTTINDTATANRLRTRNCLDGFDRTRAVITEHPGSAGGYKTKQTLFTARGQVWKDYEWAETTGGWACVGDDAAGFCWTENTYDWNARTTQVKRPDGKQQNFSYDGCGCAGGAVTTALDEGTEITTTVNGQPQTQIKRRQTKTFQDSLGRVVKTQLMNWEGGVAYSTAVTTYNVRDQITSTKEYSGNATGTEACPSATCQKTDLAYDGHARLKERRLPIYCTLNNATPPTCTETTPFDCYVYNNDDTVQYMTDPRGATTNYQYNKRRLVESITYGVSSGVAATPPVTFIYDAAGNRDYMTDGLGYVDYIFNSLNQLQSETRSFTELSQTYQLTYSYNLAGQLNTLGDPFGRVLTYARDKTGQVTGITGTGYTDVNTWTNRTVPTFASNIKYRAWGAVKSMKNGNDLNNNDPSKTNFDYTYNSRLQLTKLDQGGRVTEQDYYADGRLKNVRDFTYSNYNRNYEYDAAAQLKLATAGTALPKPY